MIRDQVAFILSDLHYDKAIPFILNRIDESDSYDNNGSLVYALAGLDVKEYFLQIIEIICTKDYEARLAAYEIALKYAASIDYSVKNSALRMLTECQIREQESTNDKGENSRLHFIDRTRNIL